MKDSDHRTQTSSRGIALGIFLILLGIASGIFTFVTVIGPILGLLLIVLGGIVIRRSMHSEPPGVS